MLTRLGYNQRWGSHRCYGFTEFKPWSTRRITSCNTDISFVSNIFHQNMFKSTLCDGIGCKIDKI